MLQLKEKKRKEKKERSGKLYPLTNPFTYLFLTHLGGSIKDTRGQYSNIENKVENEENKYSDDTGSSRHVQCEFAKYLLSTYDTPGTGFDAGNKTPLLVGCQYVHSTALMGISESAPFFESSGFERKREKEEE